MKKYIVTISREFGCNAREIGRTLAADLGVEFYDQVLVSKTAEKAGINADFIHDGEDVIQQNRKGLLTRFGYGSSASFLDDNAIAAQAEVIKELANKKKSAVFFGRCSDFVLREYPNHLSVFLYASLSYRICHMEKYYNLDEKSAEKLIKRVDRQRHNYYKYVTGLNRGDRMLKHVMIDVSRFGTDGVVKMIENIVNQTFCDEH